MNNEKLMEYILKQKDEEIRKIDWEPNVKNPFDGTELSEIVDGGSMAKDDAFRVRNYVDALQAYYNEIISKYREKLKSM